jgi:circadian clock protein KaiC
VGLFYNRVAATSAPPVCPRESCVHGSVAGHVCRREGAHRIEGLDDILGGGLTRNRLYLIEGVPGAGKTTLGLQYLLNGVANDESVLYVTLSETREELTMTAASHGWSLDGVVIHELVPTGESLQPQESYTMFHPSEVELTQTIKTILDVVERSRPTRVVFDSLSELRCSPARPCGTAGRSSRSSSTSSGGSAPCSSSTISADPIRISRSTASRTAWCGSSSTSSDYGAERRRVRVVKYRGQAFRGGYHDFVIRRGGLDVFRASSPPNTAPATSAAASPAASPHSTCSLAAGSSAARAR